MGMPYPVPHPVHRRFHAVRHVPLPPEPGLPPRHAARLPERHPTKLRKSVETSHELRICAGGTFSTIHAGHEYFLGMAFALGGEVEIGLTSDSFASTKGHEVPPFAERKKSLEAFLSEMGWHATITEINDAYGFALEDRFDTIVVSEETLPSAKEINGERAALGLKPLEVVAVPIIKNKSGEKITSSG